MSENSLQPVTDPRQVEVILECRWHTIVEAPAIVGLVSYCPRHGYQTIVKIIESQATQ